MKPYSFFAGLLLGALGAAAFSAARSAHAADTAAQIQLISNMKDTAVYSIKYDGHDCILASTIGGSGVSLQCSR